MRWWEVLSAGSSSGQMDGWIEGTFCSSCAGSVSHIVPGEAGCHLWFKGPSVSTDGNRTWPLWRPLHSFLKERQIKHAWDGDRGGPATFFTLCPSLHSVSLTCLLKKKHLEDCVSLILGELKVEDTALQKQKMSCFIFTYITPLKQISVCNPKTDKGTYNGLMWTICLKPWENWNLSFSKSLFIQGRVSLSANVNSTALFHTPESSPAKLQFFYSWCPNTALSRRNDVYN